MALLAVQSSLGFSTTKPGIGLGEKLPDLGVIQQAIDLVERSPMIPVAERIFDMFERAGQRRVVQHFGDVIAHRLEDFLASANVSVRQASFESFTKGPA